MPIDDRDLTRQDEDISPAEFAAEERREHYAFGNWPEIAGTVFTLFVIWLIFAFTG
ncbi:hypothetical protein [Roseibium marinum]|uniref:Aa3 type cytochrome c oxidase subunit IV n=1 Tax=Roseibium marinum TaxID=281252 RepID=A0A2S3V2H9_9HYPH|nr:hypothetical protein [Roseibium marinum]POF34158.1 hypothetical protein CLV41_101610 [Roseibium marinum]